ncbi:MAG TPA: sulfide/dihydroorotate dehydrogenase-like FAD/NAD-binding protein [Clostridia bacterium]|nr:sulfide/dihydroorotate dehydrogenase-like FAD/NAD-binding protein [Clostridia bacterium]
MLEKMGITNCIDAGTEYCPCYLAETGECIMCSQLQGKVFCDCINWRGVCIYQEYIWNNVQSKERRPVHACRILEQKEIAPLVTLLKIQVKRTLARELNQPGAYVFLRAPAYPTFFDLPMSIMSADERAGIIEIAVQKRGIKTKYLLQQEGQKEVLLRGPYWNGILGLKYLKSFQKGKALLVVRGIGQAPALPVARKLLQGGNEVEVLLDRGRIEVDFTGDLFRKMGCQVREKELLKREDFTITEETLIYLRESFLQRGFGLIYGGGSELLHQGISCLLQEVERKVYFVCSNNAQLCCGEGVCGSCQTRLADGSRVKRCKTQLEPLSIYGGR